MPGSDASAHTKASSGGSSSPVEINGVVFLRTRRCPASGLCNTDPNVISKGPLGPQYSANAIWNRGTSQNPVSRFECVSVLTFEHGGFADKHKTLDDFVIAMQVQKPLSAEFKAAYKVMVEEIEEGRMRFRKAGRDKLALRLQDARRVAVESFRKAQVRVQGQYTAIEVEAYEEMHRGRIAAKKMKVERTLCADGVYRDCVWVSVLPTGHHKVITEQVSGSAMREEVDDGSVTTRANQQRDKFENLRAKTVWGCLAQSREQGLPRGGRSGRGRHFPRPLGR